MVSLNVCPFDSTESIYRWCDPRCTVIFLSSFRFTVDWMTLQLLSTVTRMRKWKSHCSLLAQSVVVESEEDEKGCRKTAVVFEVFDRPCAEFALHAEHLIPSSLTHSRCCVPTYIPWLSAANINSSCYYWLSVDIHIKRLLGIWSWCHRDVCPCAKYYCKFIAVESDIHRRGNLRLRDETCSAFTIQTIAPHAFVNFIGMRYIYKWNQPKSEKTNDRTLIWTWH